ncbi:autophagy protein Apg5-domain-containing protein [Blastocladiella britannica]|nr:autophagy protein Apg5-domain-containing protein [Blastocladiella britannica]
MSSSTSTPVAALVVARQARDNTTTASASTSARQHRLTPPLPTTNTSSTGNSNTWDCPEIAAAVFHATVPVSLTFPPSSDLLPPLPPLHCNVPRTTYLPAALANVPHLAPHTTGAHAVLAFHHTSTTLMPSTTPDVVVKWYYPAGALFDVRVAGHARAMALAAKEYHPSNEDDAILAGDPLDTVRFDDPWPITATVTPLPPGDSAASDAEAAHLLVTPFTGMERMATMYMSSVKEAEYMCYGSSKKVMSLAKEASQGLWEAVLANNLTAFEPTFTALFLTDPLTRAWPVRLFLVPHPSPIDDDTHGEVVPLPVSYIQPFVAVSAATTVGDLLTRALVSPSAADKLEGSVTELVAAHGVVDPLDADDHGPIADEKKVVVEAVCQGLVLAHNTPLTWMHRHLVGADGWVWMVARLWMRQRRRQHVVHEEDADLVVVSHA